MKTFSGFLILLCVAGLAFGCGLCVNEIWHLHTSTYGNAIPAPPPPTADFDDGHIYQRTYQAPPPAPAPDWKPLTESSLSRPRAAEMRMRCKPD